MRRLGSSLMVELTATNCPSPRHVILTRPSSPSLRVPSSTCSGTVGSRKAFAPRPWNCVSFFPQPTDTWSDTLTSSGESVTFAVPSKSRVMKSTVSSQVAIANSSSSGLHWAAAIPASTDPTISIKSWPGSGSSRTTMMSPPARIRTMVLVSAKQCKLRILSNSRFGLGEGASHDAIGTACSGEYVSLGNRLRESNGSLGLGPNAHKSESSEGSHAVAVSGAVSRPNSKVLSLMFRRLRILSA